jgi:cell division septal protein FtsQ
MAKTQLRRVGVNQRNRMTHQQRMRKEHLKSKGKSVVKNLWKIVLFFLVTGGMTFAGYTAYKGIQDSGVFILKEVKVKGMDRLTKEEVLTRTGVELGWDMDKIEESSISNKLLECKWIFSATVKKAYPSQLHIEIQEVQPIAVSFMNNQWLIVSDKGEYIEGDITVLSAYPMIAAANQEDLVSGTKILKKIKQQYPNVYGGISQFAVQGSVIKVFLTGRKHALLLDAHTYTNETISRYELLWSNYRTQLSDIVFVDLRVSGFAYLQKGEKNG